MEVEINWKERYIELENQMIEMMKMTSDLIDKETALSQDVSKPNTDFTSNASITKLLYTSVDDTLEIIAISKSTNPTYIFELIDDKTKKIIFQKSEIKKNSCRFNVSGLSEYRIKVHIRNEDDEYYSDTKTSRLINKRIKVGI